MYMQTKIEELTTQISSLKEENKSLKETSQKNERKVELLCAIVGENSSQGLASYVGDSTFKNNLNENIIRIDDMMPKCLEMVDDFDSVVQQRAESLLSSSEEKK